MRIFPSARPLASTRWRLRPRQIVLLACITRQSWSPHALRGCRFGRHDNLVERSRVLERGAWLVAPESTKYELRLKLRSLVRVSSRDSLSLQVFMVRNHRTAGGVDERVRGVGDISLDWRHELSLIGQIQWAPRSPQGVLVPTGRATHRSETVLGADVPGPESWQTRLVLMLAWISDPCLSGST